MEQVGEAALAVLNKGWSNKLLKSVGQATQESPDVVEKKIRKVIQVFDAARGAKVVSDETAFREVCVMNDLEISQEEAAILFHVYQWVHNEYLN